MPTVDEFLGPAPGPARQTIDEFLGAAPPPTGGTAISASPWYQRVAHGFAAPLFGLDVLASHVEQKLPFVSEATKSADLAAAEREIQDFKRSAPAGFDWAETMGNILNPANYLAVGRGMGLASEMLGGAGAATVQPVESNRDYWTEKAKNIGLGGATGVVGSRAVRAGAKAIAPVIGASAQRLSDALVPLTPGQLLSEQGMGGKVLRTAESALRSFPILGSYIRGAEGRSVEGFNRAVTNQALEPIGEKLPAGMKIGPDSVRYADDAASRSYEDLLPQLSFRPDQEFHTNMSELVRDVVPMMPAPQQAQLAAVVKTQLTDRLSAAGGVLDGHTLKRASSELRYFANAYTRSQNPAQQQLGRAVNQVRQFIKTGLERQNPDHAQALANIDYSYAMISRLRDASIRRTGSEGIFTPNDLLASIKRSDATAGKRAYAHGDGLLQSFALAGQRIIPEKIPDSGTSERALWNLLPELGGAAGLGVLSPKLLAPLAAIPAYTPSGGAILQSYLASGPTRAAFGNLVSGLSQPASAASSAGLMSSLYR